MDSKNDYHIIKLGNSSYGMVINKEWIESQEKQHNFKITDVEDVLLEVSKVDQFIIYLNPQYVEYSKQFPNERRYYRTLQKIGDSFGVTIPIKLYRALVNIFKIKKNEKIVFTQKERDKNSLLTFFTEIRRK